MNFSTNLGGIIIICAVALLLILFIKRSSKTTVSAGNTAENEPADVKTQSAASIMIKQNTDELELVAVITAAIAASMGTTSDKLRVKSLRKVERRVL